MNGSHILKDSVYITAVVIIGKFLGMLKQVMIAWLYGSSVETDMFFIADSTVSLLSSVIVSSVPIGFLTVYIHLRMGRDERDRFVSNSLATGGALSIFLVLFLYVSAPVISIRLAPTFDSEQVLLLTKYIRTIAITIIPLTLSAIIGASLEGEKRFVPSKLQGIFVSSFMITSMLLLSERIGIYAIVAGFIIGCFAYLFFLSSTLFLKLNFRFHIPKRDSRVWKIIVRCIPLVMGTVVVDINHIVDKTIASGLGEGAVSALYYAQIVSIDLITAVIVTSLSSIIITKFAQNISEKDETKLISTVNQAINVMELFIVQASILLLCFSNEIIALLFGRGEFDITAIQSTGAALKGYALGLCFIPYREVLARVHYAYQDTKWPMINSLFGVVINVLLSYFLSKILGVFGIALATSISLFVMSIMMRISIKRHVRVKKIISINPLIKLTVGGIASYIVIMVLKASCENGITSILLIGIISTTTYLAVLFLIRCEPMIMLIQILKRTVLTMKSKGLSK